MSSRPRSYVRPITELKPDLDGPSQHQSVKAACIGPKANLHCITLYGDKSDIELWVAYGGDFGRVQGHWLHHAEGRL